MHPPRLLRLSNNNNVSKNLNINYEESKYLNINNSNNVNFNYTSLFTPPVRRRSWRVPDLQELEHLKVHTYKNKNVANSECF